ncbi:MAG: hypothetical protein ACPHET_08745 [Miltoncostaeaceae bacterium]
MKNPRHEAKVVAAEAESSSGKRADGLPKGAPRRAGMKSVLIRAGIAALIFFAFMYYLNGDSATTAFAYAAIMGLLMIPLGMLLDRFAHRMAMRRWERQTGRR